MDVLGGGLKCLDRQAAHVRSMVPCNLGIATGSELLGQDVCVASAGFGVEHHCWGFI